MNINTTQNIYTDVHEQYPLRIDIVQKQNFYML